MTRRLAAMIALLLVLAMVTCSAIAAPCSWGEPGRNPYTGSRQAAIMGFDHIPLVDRLAIAWQVRFRHADDQIDIHADRISGSSNFQYGAEIYGMHFGRSTKCETVTRSAWAAGHSEPAGAYCRGAWCVIVPNVCGNVAWVVRDKTPASVLAASGQVNRVPEPASLGLTLAALAAAAATVRGRA